MSQVVQLQYFTNCIICEEGALLGHSSAVQQRKNRTNDFSPYLIPFFHWRDDVKRNVDSWLEGVHDQGAGLFGDVELISVMLTAAELRVGEWFDEKIPIPQPLPHRVEKGSRLVPF